MGSPKRKGDRVNTRGIEIKTNRIIKIEDRGDWKKIFYKVPKGRKVYSLFVERAAVQGDKVENFLFKGVIERGKGVNRSFHDKPIPCMVVASFACRGGGGYIVRTLSSNKIMQVQSFKERKEKRSVFNTQGNKKVS